MLRVQKVDNFLIEARSTTESKKQSNIQFYKSTKDIIFYIVFYNNMLASSHHEFFEHVI